MKLQKNNGKFVDQSLSISGKKYCQSWNLRAKSLLHFSTNNIKNGDRDLRNVCFAQWKIIPKVIKTEQLFTPRTLKKTRLTTMAGPLISKTELIRSYKLLWMVAEAWKWEGGVSQSNLKPPRGSSSRLFFSASALTLEW